jgi:outer membrane protein TolC
MLLQNRFLRIAIVTLVCMGTAFGGETVVSKPGILHMTLGSAIRMALSRNYSLQAEQLGPEAARERVTSSLGRFDPLLDFSIDRTEDTNRNAFINNGRVGRNSVNRLDRLSTGISGTTPIGTEYGLGFGSRNNTGSFNEFDEEISSELRLNLRQPLLRGFGTDSNMVNVRIARTNVQVSEWQLRQRIIDVITQIEYVYNDLHTAHGNLRVAIRSQDLARQLMNDNIKRAEIGVMTPLNITTARAEVAAREEAVILARRNVFDNENFLKQLVTDDLARMLAIRVEIEPPTTPTSRADVQIGISQALALRPDYRQAVLDIQRRNIQLAFQRDQVLPQLDLVGSLRLLGFDNDFGTSVNRIPSRDSTAWNAGAVFSIPLGNRSAQGNLNAARIESAQALINLQRLEQQIIVDVDNAAGQITTNQERIDSTTEARKLAEESLAAGEERLRAGTGTTFEVLELQDRLSSAEFAELRARADFNKAVAEFHRQTGTTLRERGVKVD